MSDDWRYYICQMGDHLASIMVDVGIAKSMDSAPTRLAQLRLIYKQPSGNGLPTDAEFEAVVAVENQLLAAIDGSPDVFAGRFTTQGYRQFHTYTTHDDAFWGRLAGRLANESGYTIQLNIDDDPERGGYWQALYPTPDDWQVINDTDTCAVLKKNGDDPDIERKFDHWIYFPDEQASAPFLAWVKSSRFVDDPQYSESADDGTYCVRVHHVGTAHQLQVSNHTIELRRKAEEFGGKYDGWEAPVERGDGTAHS